MHLRLLKGEISLGESRKIRWEKFLEECQYKNSQQDAMTIANFYSAAYYKAERVVPGTFELLNALQQI